MRLSKDLINLIGSFIDYRIYIDYNSWFENHLDKIGWGRISSNMNISPRFYVKYKEKVSWDKIMKTETISLTFLKEIVKMGIPLSFKLLRLNSIVPIEFIMNNIDNITDDDKLALLLRSDISIQLIKDMVQIHDHITAIGLLLFNRNLSDEIYTYIIDHYGNMSFIECIEVNDGVSEDVMTYFINKQSSRSRPFIYRNNSLSAEFFKKHNNILNWSHVFKGNGFDPALSKSPVMATDLIWNLFPYGSKNYGKFFDHVYENYRNMILWNDIWSRPISLKSFVDIWNKHSEKIDWPVLSGNINLSDEFYEFLVYNCHDMIDWNYYCSNPSIKETIFRRALEKCPEKICWPKLCANSNMSLKFFEDNRDKICWDTIGKNNHISFCDRKEQFIKFMLTCV